MTIKTTPTTDDRSLVGARTARRMTGAAGIGFGCLMIARIILSPEYGNPDESGTLIAAKIAAHSQGVLIDAFAGGIAVVLFLIFGAGLAGSLRRNGAPRELAMLVQAGSILVGALASVQHVFQAVLAFGAGSPADGPLSDPVLTHTLINASVLSDTMMLFGAALAIGGASLAAARIHMLSRKVTVFGYIATAICVAGAGAFSHDGVLAIRGPIAVLALLSMILWSISAGVAMVRRPRTEQLEASYGAEPALAPVF